MERCEMRASCVIQLGKRYVSFHMRTCTWSATTIAGRHLQHFKISNIYNNNKKSQ